MYHYDLQPKINEKVWWEDKLGYVFPFRDGRDLWWIKVVCRDMALLLWSCKYDSYRWFMWTDESNSDLKWNHQVSTQTSSFTEERIKSCFNFKDGWSPYQTLTNNQLLKLPITSQKFKTNKWTKPNQLPKKRVKTNTQHPPHRHEVSSLVYLFMNKKTRIFHNTILSMWFRLPF